MFLAIKNSYEKIQKKLLTYCILLCVLFFGINFGIEFATDTYATFEELGTWQWMLYENGRLVNALVYYLFELLPIPVAYIYKLSYMVALLFAALSCYLLSDTLFHFTGNALISVLLSFFTILNFYVIEYFLFIEKGLFLTAIFLCVCAFRFTIKFFKCSCPGYLLLSFFCLLTAVFMYQGLLGLFAVLCLPFILIFSENIKQFIRFNFTVALLYALPMICGYIVTSFLLQSERVKSLDFSIERIKYVLDNLLSLSVSKWFHVPSYTFLLFFFLSLTLFFLSIRYMKEKKFLKEIFSFFYLLFGVIFISFFLHFTGITSDYLPRVLFPYGCLFGTIIIYSALLNKKNILLKLPLKNAFIFLLTLMLSIQYINFQAVFIDRYRCNQADYYYCQILSFQIEKYEKETGKIIHTICFYNDQNVLWWERGYDESNLNTRAQSCGWSNLTAINHYMDKSYVKGEPLAKYQEYFSQFDWGTYTEEQLIFTDNTLHLCIY